MKHLVLGSGTLTVPIKRRMDPGIAMSLDQGEFIKTEHDSDCCQTDADFAESYNGLCEEKLRNYIKIEKDVKNMCKLDYEYEKYEEIQTHSKISDLSLNLSSFKNEIHHDERPLFRGNSESITVHVATVVSADDDSTVPCSTSSPSKAQLNEHMKTHIGENPHKCEPCDRCFSERNHQQTQMMTNSGEKPYKCEDCGMCFSKKDHLKSHKCFFKTENFKIHIREKAYKCGVCDKCFYAKRNLQTHMTTHTGEKPYKCEHCDKCFSHNGTLTKHKRTHTDEKPYKCEHCDKSFSIKYNLKTHMKTHI